jgi:import receptor subunit TOM22
MVKKQGLFMAKKPAKSTGKAAWITGTTFIVLVLPLLIAMDREYQLNELDLPERSLLGVPIHN